MSSVTEVAVPTSDFDGNVVRGFSGDSACREESASAGIRFGAGGLRPGLCGLLVRP